METTESAQQQVADRPAAPEYRMIAFSLGGRDYGIDIMKVKEISREGKFTYVPNTASFVLGVHNLRGEIIPVIDLRRMFNIPVPKGEEGAEQSMLILRLPDLVVGVVVDTIDGVRSAPADSIQPPHPIFGDINMQYISGVLEREGKLFILLDVERIFRPAPAAAAPQARPVRARAPAVDQDLRFVCEGLAALVSFHATPVNMAWVEKRFGEWRVRRADAGKSAQLENGEDAREFLAGFASTRKNALWSDADRAALASLLQPAASGSLGAWDHGCGRGFGAYSLACALRAAFPRLSVKVWASEGDLVEIAAAPTLTLPKDRVPRFYIDNGFMMEGTGGLQFTAGIRESIVFEFTESLYRVESPPVDLVLCQDVLSFQPQESQRALLDAFAERLKPGGVLILGVNELADGEGWRAVEKGGLRAYTRENPKE